MRVSSSLLLILAAITMANAAVTEPSAHPKHKLVRVKNGNAHVNALDAAKVKASPDLKNLKSLVTVAAKRGVDISAINSAAHANVDAVDLKHVASIVHTLSATLESQNKEADAVLKIKDQKLAAVKAEKLLDCVKTSLADAVVDIHRLTAGTSKKASLAKLRREVLQAVDLNAVTSMISSAKISGAIDLVSLLSGIKVEAILQGDVVSVLRNGDMMETIHGVANVDVVLSSVVAVPEAVPLIKAMQEVESPVSFVAAFSDIGSLTSLVAAAPGGLNAISKVDGSQKLVAYIGQYGFSTVARILAVGGVEAVLSSVVAVPGSVKVLDSMKSVADVPAFVSGLHILNVPTFVSSLQKVTDIAALTNVMKTVHGVAPIKRELLSGVESTVDGLDVTKVLNLKRGIAHIAALKDSDLVSIEQNVKRALLNDAELKAVLANMDVAKIGLIKRSIVDLSMLNEKEVDALRAAMKRDLLSGLPVGGVVQGLPVGGVVSDVEGIAGGLRLVKKDVLSGVPAVGGILGTVRGSVGPATDSVDKIKRDVLGTLSGSGSGDLLGHGGAALNVLDLNGGPVAKIAGSGDGLLGSGGGELSYLDLNRILAAVQRRDLLAPVNGIVSDVDVAQILPVLKREILEAGGVLGGVLGASSTVDSVGHAFGAVGGEVFGSAAALVHRRADKAVDVELLDHAIDTFSTDATSMLTKTVAISDAVHVDKITKDVRTEVVPLVAAVAKSLSPLVSAKAPTLVSKVDKLAALAQKTAQSLH